MSFFHIIKFETPPKILIAKESGTRVGIMKHGRLVAEMHTDELGHADLEQIYLENMRD